jgi:hypothetical protein
MNNQRGDVKVQRIRLDVDVLVPIQTGAHVTRIEERAYEALHTEFEQDFLQGGYDPNNCLQVRWHGCWMAGYREDSEEYRLQTGLTREAALDFLRQQPPEYQEMAKEYFQEAEHQDGEDYWRISFVNLKELADDFSLFTRMALEHRKEKGWDVNTG